MEKRLLLILFTCKHNVPSSNSLLPILVFLSFSSYSEGVNDIKELFDVASNEYRLTGKSTILFLDEIHRFNKRQQDVLLPYIECGIIILIGATTEMPSFCLNNVST